MKGVPMDLWHFLYGALFALCWIGGRTQFIECNGITSSIADGYCDRINNNIECGYDGGDCCECTCSRGRLFPCGFNGFDCLVPSASNVASKCQHAVSNSRLCSTEDTVQDWIVKKELWVNPKLNPQAYRHWAMLMPCDETYGNPSNSSPLYNTIPTLSLEQWFASLNLCDTAMKVMLVTSKPVDCSWQKAPWKSQAA